MGGGGAHEVPPLFICCWLVMAAGAAVVGGDGVHFLQGNDPGEATQAPVDGPIPCTYCQCYGDSLDVFRNESNHMKLGGKGGVREEELKGWI